MNTGLREPAKTVFMDPDIRRDDVEVGGRRMETREIVEAFVAAVNGGRPEKIGPLMDVGHVFVDSLGQRIEGRRAATEGWRAYLKLFPDYRIEVEAMIIDGFEALLHGRAGGTLHRLEGPVAGGHWRIPAAWRAVTDSKRVLLWQVYADNEPVRAVLSR
jgi:hypothetical protein